MRVLTPEGEAYDVNQIVDGINRQKYCVLDLSDQSDIDYRFQPCLLFNEYEYPAVELKIGDYSLEVPMNWRILTGDMVHGDLEIVDIDELTNFEYQAFVFNPFKSFKPKFLPVQITNSYTSMTSWFVPKLQKKHVLGVPLGIERQWPTAVNSATQQQEPYPECVWLIDDIDRMNAEISLSDIF